MKKKQGKTLMEVFASEQKKMYNYSIGYSTFDQSSYIDLMHEEKFTYDEITQMVAEAIEVICKHMIDNEPKLYYHMLRIYNLWKPHIDNCPSVADYLIAEKGFVPVKKDVCWSIDGFATVLEDNDKSEECSAIRKYLKLKNVDLENLEVE